jgi:hypothetical protein
MSLKPYATRKKLSQALRVERDERHADLRLGVVQHVVAVLVRLVDERDLALIVSGSYATY